MEVNIPKITVGIKLEKLNIENPIIIVGKDCPRKVLLPSFPT